MAYFIRTEESIEDAQKALQRGRSVRRWAFLGCSPWEHLALAVSDEEKIEALETLGYDVASVEEAERIIQDELFYEDRDEELVEALHLEPVDGGGYAEFLPGLCALASYEAEPDPSDVSETLDGTLFSYLVCYEGEFVGWDPDDDRWPLFRPTRIVWTKETGSTEKRWVETRL